jgi:hypothetical protein
LKVCSTTAARAPAIATAAQRASTIMAAAGSISQFLDRQIE